MTRDSHGNYHYTGCIHLHTTDSDGAKPHAEVVAIAQSAGLDFLLFTDHMTLKSREREGKWHGKLLSIIGYEHNDSADRNHYLIFGSPAVYDTALAATGYVAAAARDHAVGIIAHPDEIRPADGKFPPFPWTAWSAQGFTGVEIWNHMSDWMERLETLSTAGKIALLFSPRKFMVTPPETTLRRWDELNATRRVVGIGGADAHEFPYQLGPKRLKIFPYKVHFRTLQSHLVSPAPLSSNYETAVEQTLDAIREARLYFSNRRWGSAAGFEFWGATTRETAWVGGTLGSLEGAKLYVNSPRVGDIKIIRNGEIVVGARSNALEYAPTTPGVYRAEVHQRGRGWIYSNHIRVAMD